MFSRDSEKLGTEKVGTFFIAVEEKAPTVAFILLGVLSLLLEESVKGSTVLFNFKILPGVGGILRCGIFGFCLLSLPQNERKIYKLRQLSLSQFEYFLNTETSIQKKVFCKSKHTVFP